VTALDTLGVEPGQSPAHKADRSGLLFVSMNLDVGQPCGIFDGDIDLVLAHASRAALLTVARDAAVAHLSKAGQLFHVDVGQVAWRLTFVALDRRFGLQVA